MGTGIILKSLPNIEWAPENLTGHGGTEIDGRWYYTYDQAVAAAAELGEGWRLPTQAEFQQLADSGSTWDSELKGRWFGGNHDTDHEGSLFLPACGYLGRASRALVYVETTGDYLCSWTGSAHNGAGDLLFDHSSSEDIIYDNSQMFFSAVRLVRNNN